MSRRLRVAVFAGEPSGDILGATIVSCLRSLVPRIDICGVTGPKLEAEAVESLAGIDQLSIMGITNILSQLPRLLKLRKRLMMTLIEREIDIFIGVDAPDFNLPIAKKLSKLGILTVHIVSPSVWMWREGRARNIAKYLGLMIAFLPFESPYYEKWGLPVRFVGHPLADIIPLQPDAEGAVQKLGLQDQGELLAVLPGSRRSEIERMMPILLEASERIAMARGGGSYFLFCALNDKIAESIQQFIQEKEVDFSYRILIDQTYTALEACQAALVTSGTASLEVALFKKPMVVGYILPTLTFKIVCSFMKVPWISLPNIILGSSIVAEFLQHDCNAERLSSEVIQLLEQDSGGLQQQYDDLHRQLKRNAALKAAKAILNQLRYHSSKRYFDTVKTVL